MSVDNIWDASTDTDGNTAANWSLNRVPIVGDIAVYDSATTDADCTFSGNFSCDGMRFDNAYAGTVDPVTHDPTLGTSGLDGTGGASATVNCGTGSVWTVSGDFDNADIGTWNWETSHFILDATADFITHYRKGFYDLTLSGAITVHSSYIGPRVYHALDVSGLLNINQSLNWPFAMPGSGATATISGTVTGIGQLQFAFGAKLISLTGTIDCAQTMFYMSNNRSDLWPTCQIDSALTKIQIYGANKTLTPGARTLTCTGNLLFNNSKPDGSPCTIDNSVSNPSFVVHGDVTVDETRGPFNYTKGGGTFTFGGGNDQSIDLNGWTIEDVVSDKTGGTVTLADAFTADSFTGTAGTLDPNGQTVTTVGACVWASGFGFLNAATALDGCSWIVGGAFSADSQTLQATAGWTLTVTGTAIATGVDVEHSDASGGSRIIANDSTNTDSGNNSHWVFTHATHYYETLLAGVA